MAKGRAIHQIATRPLWQERVLDAARYKTHLLRIVERRGGLAGC